MSSRFLPRKEIACSADRVDSPPCWFTISPTPLDTFSSLRKPLPSSNPRWRSLDQDALAHQNTPELQAILYSINLLVGVHNRIYFLQRPKEAATFCTRTLSDYSLFTTLTLTLSVASMKTAVAIERWQTLTRQKQRTSTSCRYNVS